MKEGLGVIGSQLGVIGENTLIGIRIRASKKNKIKKVYS